MNKRNTLFLFLFFLSSISLATTYNLSATINGAQVPTTSSVTGNLTGTYDDASNSLSYTITFGTFASSVSVLHFHGPADAGSNAGVRLGITGTSSPITGNATLDETMEAELLMGKWYVNIHTSDFGGGEIRGQVNAVPLPVELLEFNGEIRNSKIYLYWQTATEINNKGFEIEQSSDGQKFQQIGFVEGKGQSIELVTYSFVDENPKRLNYYRLRQVDYDGKSALSKIISINYSVKGKLSISPNPVKDLITFNTEKENPYKYKIYDVLGKVVLENSVKEFRNYLNLSFLQAGYYWLEILDIDGSKYTEKFYKN